MAIIELNIEKPAFKREEVVEEEEERAAGETTNDSGATRFGKLSALIGTVIVGVIGIVTLRKLRNRRRGGS